MFDFIHNNQATIITITFIIFVLANLINLILNNKPSEKQISNVREWLLWAVTEAERKLGSGTGELKLRYVYSMFIDKFAHLSKIISFEMFSEMVDNALFELKGLLTDNSAINEYVEESNKKE